MRKVFLLLCTVPLLWACSKEQQLPVPGPADGQASRLSFSVKLPAGDPVTYATIQTKQEQLVKRFDVYQFAEGADGKLEATYFNLPLSASSSGYSTDIAVDGTGKKQFFFVANNEVDNPGGSSAIVALVPGGITAGEFVKELTKTLSGSASLKTPLLMTAHIPEIDVLATGTPAQTVHLVRIMSRLDIKNYDPHFTVERVSLERVSDRSFLFHQDGTGVSQNPAGVKTIALPTATLPAAPTAVGGNDPIEMEVVAATGGLLAHTHYKHVFYPYVSDPVADKDAAPVLVVDGILFKGDPDREARVVCTKELKVDGATDFLGFERNTRYTFVIEKAVPDSLKSSLKVDQWNEESVDAAIKITAPVAIGLYGGERYTGGRAVLTEANSLLTVKGDYTAPVEVSLSCNTEWEVYPEGSAVVPADGKMNDWLTAVPFTTYWGGTYIQNSLKDAVQLTLTKNDTGVERTCRIVLRSKADNNKQSVLMVKQLPIM